MTDLSARKRWGLLPGYLAAGFVLGLADPQLGRWVQQFGVRPGVATAISVNLVLPLVAIGLAVASRRVGIAVLGAVVMSVAFTLGLATVYFHGQPWDLPTLLRSIPPVLVLACVGYVVIGTLTALTAQAVGKHEPAHPRSL